MKFSAGAMRRIIRRVTRNPRRSRGREPNPLRSVGRVQFYAAWAYARLTALRAARLSARWTARAYRMKLAPAQGCAAKKSYGRRSLFSRLQRLHARTTLPG